MNTNDTIIGAVDRGSFHFPIEFDMFSNHQYIPDAIFDTGCSHSLISIRSLNPGNKSIEELKKEALFNVNIRLGIGKGIESKDINTDQIKIDIKRINSWKNQLKSTDKSTEFLKALINGEMQARILESKLIRYEYEAINYKIDGVKIGDFNIRISFDLSNVNLIGMHIIKELYTKIFSFHNQTFLLAKKLTPLADIELDTTMDELREQLELAHISS